MSTSIGKAYISEKDEKGRVMLLNRSTGRGINIMIRDAHEDVVCPWNTQFLANEFGDIHYAVNRVLDRGANAVELWDATGNLPKDQGENLSHPYFTNQNGAGYQSFEHDKAHKREAKRKGIATAILYCR